jgi:hypothetical protein
MRVTISDHLEHKRGRGERQRHEGGQRGDGLIAARTRVAIAD